MPTASTRIAKHPRRLVFSLLCNLYLLPEEHRAHPRMSILLTVRAGAGPSSVGTDLSATFRHPQRIDPHTGEALFSMEQVKDIVRRAVDEKERALRAEEAQRARKPQPPQKSAQPQAAKPQAAAAPAKPAKGRFSNLPIERIESRIADIGRELMQIDADFSNPKTASDSAKMKKLLARREELQKEQSELEEEWLRKSG